MRLRQIFPTLLVLLTLLCFIACSTAPPPADTTAPITTAPPPITAELTEAPATTEPPVTAAPLPVIDSRTLPKAVNGGSWDSGHVQGIAIDPAREYLYFSFTDRLVKTDLDGNIIGSVEKFKGHLGDLDYNPEDGRVYGSLYIQSQANFYIAIFDADRIDRVGIDATRTDLMTAVVLPEVGDDYRAKSGGLDHRYGTYGIDGVAFGPAFGETDNTNACLTVAYAIYRGDDRADNDHQILLQFDWRELLEHEKPYRPDGHDDDGPTADTRCFVYTGNTTYGVQSLEYDAATGYWLMAAYAGHKSNFLNFSFFAVDGSIPPTEGDIVGQPTPERGLLLTLAEVGLHHAKSNTWGWWFGTPSTGMVSLDDGYFYLCQNRKDGELETADVKLYRWLGTKEKPMQAVTP